MATEPCAMATAFTIRAMGAINTCNVLWALLSFLLLCNAQSSVPIATQPIVSDVTLTSVIPSLQTIYSVITTSSTEAVAPSISTVTTVVSGETTTILSTASGEANARPVVIQTITSTLVSTISITTTQVVQSTIGFTTILGSVTASETGAPPLESTTTATTDATSSLTGASDAVITSDSPSTTGYSTVDAFSISSMASITGTASVTAGPGPSPSVRASSGGLTPGSKAGIAIGVILGVTALVVAGFLLGQRYSRRRSAVRDYDSNSAVFEKDAFQAGRPYELTGSNRHPTEMSNGKMHPYSPTTAETTSGPGSVSAQSYEMPGSAVTPHSEPAELSALPQFEDKDPAPMYVGVPAHMSGSKRWSMKEYEKS